MGLPTKLKRVLGLERGDLSAALPIAVAYALNLAAIYVLKPARNALFLDRVGVESLPWVLILVAVTGGGFVAIYGRFASLMRTDRLLQLTLLIMVGVMLAFRPLLELEARWIYFVFFVWVQVFGLVTTSLAWVWASSAFDPRRARRVFGLIGTGGIAGAIVGGLFTSSFAAAVGTTNLLYVAAVLVGLILAAFQFAPSPADGAESAERGADAHGRRGSAGGSRSTARPEALGRLPRLLAINAALIAIAAVFVDIQFNDVVDRHFDSSEAKAAFFGAFFAGVSGFSLLFQVVVTPWLLRSFGVGPALSVLPGALGLGSLVLLLGPYFPVATLPKAADGSFRHSIHKAASELLYLPIPEATKRRAKLFIDTTVDTAATGIGALAVVGLTRGLGLSYGQLTIFTITFIAASLWLVRRVRSAYVDAFRHAIERRHIDLSRLTVGLNEAGVLDLLLPALRSDQPRQVLYALDLLSSVRSASVREAVAPLLRHEDARIRTRAVEVLGPDPATLDARGHPQLLRDDDPDVRTAALRVWADGDPDSARELIGAWLDDDDPRRIGPALSASRALPADDRRALLSDERLDRLEGIVLDQPELAPPWAGALAAAAEPRLYARLERLLADAPQAVMTAAIDGFAQSADAAYVPWLVDRLADRRSRAAARRALAAFGPSIVVRMAEVADDDGKPLTVRRAAVRTLSDVGDNSAINALMDRLQSGEPVLEREVIDALARIRRRNPRARFPKARVREAMLERVREWRLILASLRWLPEPNGDPARLFHRAMQEKATRLREEIFLLLGLRYDYDQMADAGQRIIGGDPGRRANALEFLENAIAPEWSRVLLPLFEADDPERALRQTDPELGALPRRASDLLGQWARCRDPWLAACALYAAASIDPAVDPALWSSGGDLHPLVNEVLGAAASERAS